MDYTAQGKEYQVRSIDHEIKTEKQRRVKERRVPRDAPDQRNNGGLRYKHHLLFILRDLVFWFWENHLTIDDGIPKASKPVEPLPVLRRWWIDFCNEDGFAFDLSRLDSQGTRALD